MSKIRLFLRLTTGLGLSALSHGQELLYQHDGDSADDQFGSVRQPTGQPATFSAALETTFH